MARHEKEVTDGHLTYIHVEGQYYRCECGVKTSLRAIQEGLHRRRCKRL
jgi:hypothetical protein